MKEAATFPEKRLDAYPEKNFAENRRDEENIEKRDGTEERQP